MKNIVLFFIVVSFLPLYSGKSFLTLRSFFNLLDTNKDQNLEMKEVVRHKDESLTKELFLRQANSLQSSFSMDDFCKDLFGYKCADLNKISSTSIKKILKSELSRLIEADFDKNNLINLDEFFAFKHPEFHPNMTEFNIAQLIEQLDNNKDDKVDFSEYLTNHPHSEYGREKVSPEIMESQKKTFTLHDINGDGYLVKEELGSWINPGYHGLAKRLGEKLFENSDKNMDGLITFEELEASKRYWMKHEITDFGSHFLHDEL